jgi:hypothetical protein
MNRTRYGAVLDPGRHRLETHRLDPLRHLRRERGSGDVDISWWIAEERIADRAADDAGLFAGAVEHGKKLAQRRLSEPCSVEAAGLLRHFV